MSRETLICPRRRRRRFPVTLCRSIFRPHNKYAALTYYHLDAQQPLCGTIHNHVSKEMLFCSSSTGEDFDDRSRKLREHQDIVSGILTESGALA